MVKEFKKANWRIFGVDYIGQRADTTIFVSLSEGDRRTPMNYGVVLLGRLIILWYPSLSTALRTVLLQTLN